MCQGWVAGGTAEENLPLAKPLGGGGAGTGEPGQFLWLTRAFSPLFKVRKRRSPRWLLATG